MIVPWTSSPGALNALARDLSNVEGYVGIPSDRNKMSFMGRIRAFFSYMYERRSEK